MHVEALLLLATCNALRSGASQPACGLRAAPVPQDADSTDVYTISRNWADLVKRARAKQLRPEEYNSLTFTLSNLGMFGADQFDAILPPGERSAVPPLLGM